MPNFARGAYPSPRHKLAAATPYILGAPHPAQFFRNPKKLSAFGNITNGNCVTAEEAAKLAVNPSEILIPDDEVIAWATANGFLNGAFLPDVMAAMQKSGFSPFASSEKTFTYGDGEPTSVDWTNAQVLQNAIYAFPVKIGIAADQLQATVQTLQNGWFATGYTADSNEDHCTALWGYGTIHWLAQQLGVAVPGNIDGTQQGYEMFSWGTIGVIDVPSLLAITGEAWLRTPGTIVQPVKG